MLSYRKIIHVDMDAFYASIEQRDSPQYKGKPVIISGDPHKRGVVATCSYEARKYGVRSAMPSIQAYRLCPQGIFVEPRFDVYKIVSLQIREIFHRYTDLVEPLSLDEAFLDVTDNKMKEPSATRLSRKILQEIFRETGLTASAGVSFNKFLAKVASDMNKPFGITVVPPEKADAFINQLPIRKFFGIGEATERKMGKMGIKTGEDLKKVERENLIERFGKSGDWYFQIAHCQDERPVNPHRTRKSIGKETTFEEDVSDNEILVEVLEEISQKLQILLKQHQKKARTITLKIRYCDFKTLTRSRTFSEPLSHAEDIFSKAKVLLENVIAFKRPVRLVGITLSHLF